MTNFKQYRDIEIRMCETVDCHNMANMDTPVFFDKEPTFLCDGCLRIIGK